MTKFYTIISFSPEPSARTDGYPSRAVRSCVSLQGARNVLKMAALARGEGITHRILRTEVFNDGVVHSEWVE